MVKLVKASCNNNYPFCVHYGFLIGDTIIHNTPERENSYGGNIVTEKFELFKSKRKIHSIEDTNLSEDQVWSYVDKNKNRKFDYLNYNCQQFANEVMTGKKKLSILSRALILLSIGYIAYKKTKKK